jgi:hypothetical protein
MARPRKVPAVLVEATVKGNGKLADLPSDSARLGFFYVVLGDAKLAAPVPGQFTSRGQFKEVAGRFARYLDDYVKVGVLEVAPRLCARCKARWSAMPPKSGAMVVHDWHEHQYDPRKIERQREYEDRQRADQLSISDAVSDGQSDGVSDRVSDRVSDAIPTGDSRGGAPDRAVNHEPRTENEEHESIPRNGVYPAPNAEEPSLGRSEPLLDKRQLAAWQPYRRDQWAGFKAAWFARGFKLPPQGDPDDPRSQAHIVWEILDNRGDELASWVADAPGKTSHEVVHHLLERWQRIKADAGIEDEQVVDVERDPTSTPESAKDILARLGARPEWAGGTDAAPAKAERPAEVAS